MILIVRFMSNLLTFGIVVSIAARCAAISFTPFPCSTSVPLEIDWPFDSLNLDDGFEENEPLSRSSGTINYANNISNTRHFFANSYVRSIEFHATVFQTEATYDRLTLRQGSNTPYYMSYNTTTPFWTNYTGTPTISDVLQYKGVSMNFKTDNSVTKRGFAIDKVRVTCQAAAGSNLPDGVMRAGDRYTGILLAQDDVVNFTYYSPVAGGKLHIALWGPTGLNKSLGLYVRCGAMPTPSTFGASSTGGTSHFLEVPTSVCSDPYAVRITVHNQGSSPMPFNIMLSEAQDVTRVLRVATEGASPAQVESVRVTMLNVMRQFYGLTEGQVRFNSVEIYRVPAGTIANMNFTQCKNSCGANDCDLCFVDEPGGGGNAITGRAIVRPGSWFDPDVIVHELHHSLMAIDWDEFDWNKYAMCETCGHSISENSWNRGNNLCVGGASGFVNHTKDRGVKADGSGTCSADTHVSGWAGQSMGLYPPAETPDIFNFATMSLGQATYIF